MDEGEKERSRAGTRAVYFFSSLFQPGASSHGLQSERERLGTSKRQMVSTAQSSTVTGSKETRREGVEGNEKERRLTLGEESERRVKELVLDGLDVLGSDSVGALLSLLGDLSERLYCGRRQHRRGTLQRMAAVQSVLALFPQPQ
jgi:hypothetical protein